MEIQRLREFLVLAEVLSISKAAVVLKITQPVLSRHLQELEHEFGVPLLNRGSGQAGLTASGERLVTLASEMVNLSDQIGLGIRNMGSRARVRLNIGFTPCLMPVELAEIIRRAQQRHPDLEVRFFEAHPAEQLNALARNELDLAFVGEMDEKVERQFDAVFVGKVSMYAVVPKAWEPPEPGPVSLKSFWDRLFVGLDETMFPMANVTVRKICAEAGFSPDFSMLAGGLCAQLEMVLISDGVALMPQCASKLPHEKLVFRPLAQPGATLKVYAVMAKDERRREIQTIADLIVNSASQPGLALR